MVLLYKKIISHQVKSDLKLITGKKSGCVLYCETEHISKRLQYITCIRPKNSDLGPFLLDADDGIRDGLIDVTPHGS